MNRIKAYRKTAIGKFTCKCKPKAVVTDYETKCHVDVRNAQGIITTCALSCTE